MENVLLIWSILVCLTLIAIEAQLYFMSKEASEDRKLLYRLVEDKEKAPELLEQNRRGENV